jgi:hypothetical protein
MSTPHNPSELKFCIGCRKPKPMRDFPRNRESPDGRLRHCFECFAGAKATPKPPKPSRVEIVRPCLTSRHNWGGVGDIFEGPFVEQLASVFRQMGEIGFGKHPER